MNVLEIRDLGKAYRTFGSQWRRIFSWFGLPVKPVEEHWVLRNISLNIAQGEAVGIVGQNGAGKSTLLKLITGTQRPTEGSVQVHGRVSAILELGMGFNPEFTGRQNAWHGLGLMGLRSDEIDQLMPSVEAFAEIGDYFDQPLRTYSSGMQMRVAFAVVTAYRPDILIVDEALSVGDRYFSQKSFNRIQTYLDQGTTLLFVSHDSTAVKALCDRAILMEKGRVTIIADPESVVDRYNGLLLERANKLGEEKSIQLSLQTSDESAHSHQARHVEGFREIHAQIDTGEISLVDFIVLDATGRHVVAITTGEIITIRYRIRSNADLDELYFGISIRNNLAISIFNTTSYAIQQAPVSLKKGEVCQVTFTMRMPIQVGTYGLCMGVASGGLGSGGFERYLLNIVNAEVLDVLGTGELSHFGGVVDLTPSYEISYE